MRGARTGVLPAILVAALAILAVAGVVLVGQGVVASIIRTAPPSPVPEPVVSIESGAVTQSVDGSVTVEAGWTFAIRQWPAGSVFTRDGASPGVGLGDGELLSTVAERPMLILRGDIPAYRSLGRGVIGPDVQQLEDRLAELGYDPGPRDGVFDIPTSRAVFDFYRDRGFQPATQDGTTTTSDWLAGVPQGEVVFVPTTPVRVETVCGRAGTEPADTVCDISGGPPALYLQVARSEQHELTPGFPVRVTIGELILDATLGEVASILPPRDEEDESPPDQDLVVFRLGLGESPPAELVIGDVGTGQVMLASSSETDLRVVAIAIRDSNDGTSYVQTTEGERLSLDVGICDEGYCQVSGEDLEAGTEVTVPLALVP